jgi:hypothetical protein
VVAPIAWPSALAAQAHDHTASTSVADARLQLVLGGPHLILYHAGYLALGETQVAGLQQLRRTVCDAEAVYVERTAVWRERMPALLTDDAAPPPRSSSVAPAGSSALLEVMNGMAAEETVWLTALLRARREALGLLTAPQRAQVSALRDHWLRESIAMIEEATRPGQRGHKGTQLPIRVPGMVVGTTTLMPYCETLHGPSMHISMPGVPPLIDD